jgi:hypothetical protein
MVDFVKSLSKVQHEDICVLAFFCPTLCTLYTSLLERDDTEPCFLSSLAALDWAVSVILYL